MRIAIGVDHRGRDTANGILPYLRSNGQEAEILAGCSEGSCDYPDGAYAVGRAVASGDFDRGVLICGSGIGMCMAANKVKGVRAALVQDELTAELSRSHNDANVLCLSADLTGQTLVKRILDTWLATPFEGGRHARRVHKIEAIENGLDPSTVSKELSA